MAPDTYANEDDDLDHHNTVRPSKARNVCSRALSRAFSTCSVHFASHAESLAPSERSEELAEVNRVKAANL